MFVRLTFISIQPERTEELRKTYQKDVVPVVKNQKGNMGVRLLEPTAINDDFISVTEWETAADADLYESSGTYRTLVDKIKEMYKSKPVLKTYNVLESKVAATM